MAKKCLTETAKKGVFIQKTLNAPEESEINYDLTGIGTEDIKAEAERLIKQGNEVRDSTQSETGTQATPFMPIEGKYTNPVENIVRIGDRFEKEFTAVDTMGRQYRDHVVLKKETLQDLHGKGALAQVPYYDRAVIVPSNTNYQQIFGTCINRYYQTKTDPKIGLFPTWELLMKRVFGSQVDLGWIYLDLLYQKPTQFLPVICLVSQENGSGKTTFGNALSYLFGYNVGFFSQSDLSSPFNTWLMSNVAVFEEINETDSTLNKIKSASTAKIITVNAKYQQQITFKPFVKIIILSNNEKTFIRANKHDVRYWVRKLQPIPKEEFDQDFDAKLQSEAPAVLFHLLEIVIPKSKSRMWFSPDEICTGALQDIITESRSTCAKDLEIIISEKIDEFSSFGATVTELAELLGRRYSISEIRSAMQDELSYKPAEKTIWYKNAYGSSRPGRAYQFGDGKENSEGEIISI